MLFLWFRLFRVVRVSCASDCLMRGLPTPTLKTLRVLTAGLPWAAGIHHPPIRHCAGARASASHSARMRTLAPPPEPAAATTTATGQQYSRTRCLAAGAGLVGTERGNSRDRDAGCECPGVRWGESGQCVQEACDTGKGQVQEKARLRQPARGLAGRARHPCKVQMVSFCDAVCPHHAAAVPLSKVALVCTFLVP